MRQPYYKGVMKMNHKNHKKINYGYYAALVVGIMALLVLVGVYTTTQNLSKDEQFVDLNGDKDGLAKESLEDDTAQVGAKVADASGEKSDNSVASNGSDNQQMANADSSNTDDIGKADLVKADATTAGMSTTEEDVSQDSAANASGDADAKNDTEKKTSQDTEETSAATGGFTKKSTMSWPVQGNVILPYSMDTTVYYKTLDTYKCNPGMLISAKKGTAVYSSYAGTVLSVDKTSEHGNTVTMDLGNGYHAIYGQLADISVSAGQSVEAGAAIGTVAKASSMYSLEGNHLYFAMTKDDMPVNPEAFLQ